MTLLLVGLAVGLAIGITLDFARKLARLRRRRRIARRLASGRRLELVRGNDPHRRSNEMTTETAPADAGIHFTAEIHTWFVWCGAQGCTNCMRISTGEQARQGCAEHISPHELLALSTTDEYALGQIFSFVFRGTTRPPRVFA